MQNELILRYIKFDQETDLTKRFAKYIIDKSNDMNIKNIIFSIRVKSYDDKVKEIEFKKILATNIKSILQKEINFSPMDYEANYTLELKFTKDRISFNFITEITPIYILGSYNKYVQIPQTRWICPNCRDKGCIECDFKKKYPTSVAQEIEKVTNKIFEARELILHGSGREDKDVFCTGFRPMVIEIVNPKIRCKDLETIQNEINKEANGIEVKLDKICLRDDIVRIKEDKMQKEYVAIIDFDKCDYDLTKLIGKVLDLEQQTPNRVLHRRSDLERIRKIKIIDIRKIGPKESHIFGDINQRINYLTIDKEMIYLKLLTQAGTYVKEFVSSDDNRTKPSLSEITSSKMSVSKLVVTNFISGQDDKL